MLETLVYFWPFEKVGVLQKHAQWSLSVFEPLNTNSVHLEFTASNSSNLFTLNE